MKKWIEIGNYLLCVTDLCSVGIEGHVLQLLFSNGQRDAVVCTRDAVVCTRDDGEPSVELAQKHRGFIRKSLGFTS